MSLLHPQHVGPAMMRAGASVPIGLSRASCMAKLLLQIKVTIGLILSHIRLGKCVSR